jgi:hypothetical protein
MLRNLRALFGRPLVALDGEAGKVKDFLFDDRTWSIRYLIAETGTRLGNRPVLIPAIDFEAVDRNYGFIPVGLTSQEVRESPAPSSAQTVSSRSPLAIQRRRFLPHYWAPEAVYPAPSIIPPARDQMSVDEAANANLRSIREVIGYRVRGLNGEIGTISDFVVDDATWVARHILVRTGFWLFSRTAQLSPNCIERLSLLGKDLTAAVTRSSVRWFEARPRHRACRPKENKIVNLRESSHKPGTS